jgi:hypothetical protein
VCNRGILIAESEMDVKIQDEGQTGIKEVAGLVPTEEKIYAVSTAIFFLLNIIMSSS